MVEIFELVREFLARASRIDFELLPPTMQQDIRRRIGAALERLGQVELNALCRKRGLEVAGPDACVVPRSLSPEMLEAGIAAVAEAVKKSNGPIRWEDGIADAWEALLSARPPADTEHGREMSSAA